LETKLNKENENNKFVNNNEDNYENFNDNQDLLIETDIDEQIRQLNNIQAEPNQDVQDKNIIKNENLTILNDNDNKSGEVENRSPNTNRDQNNHQ